MLLLGIGALLCGAAQGAVVQAAPGDDIESMVNSLGPGDELVLAGGLYEIYDRFSLSVQGTVDAPVIMRSADGEVAHIHRPNAYENLIDIEGSQHLVLSGIEFSGGSAGLRFSDSDFITIEYCDIHDTADVAIRANDTGDFYDGFEIIGNEVHHTGGTGEAMYLGCNSNGCQFANALIEGNYIHHTDGPTVSQGDGIELKEGSFNNVVRDNVIHDTNYPCILTYGTVGNGGPNIIERNVMWNCGDHAIQSAADAKIRNNIILSSAADGIAMQPHQSESPSDLEVVHNTILHPTGDAISVRNASGTVIVANNALYSQSGSGLFTSGGTSTLVISGNSTDGDLSADLMDGHYGGSPPVDVYPTSGSALLDAGDPAYVTIDDFNGNARDGYADIGAYGFDQAGNPGWTLGEEFKDTEGIPDGRTEENGSDDDERTDDEGAADGIGGGGALDGGPGAPGYLTLGCACSTTSNTRTAGWFAVGMLLLGIARRRDDR